MKPLRKLARFVFSGVELQTLNFATPFLKLHQRLPSVQKLYTENQIKTIWSVHRKQKKKSNKRKNIIQSILVGI